MYKQKYQKYKKKYLGLKEMMGKGRTVGFYEMDGQKYLSFRTDNGYYVSFYEERLDNIKEEDKTTNLHKPHKNKILVVDSAYTFDYFTNKYGELKRGQFVDGVYREGNIFINWDKVAKDYKGFYLSQNKELRMSRFTHAPFKKIRYKSWWEYEFTYYNVLIFS